LVSSPAAALESDRTLTSSMRRILRNVPKVGATKAEAKQDLEINPNHPILVRLEKIRENDEPLAIKVREQIHDNALVAAGLLDDPRMMLDRLNQLLERVLSN